MSTLELNNILAYLQGLSLKQQEREWLASKLVETTTAADTETAAKAKKNRKVRPLSPEVEMLGNLHLREFSQEELESDALLAAIVEDRRVRR